MVLYLQAIQTGFGELLKYIYIFFFNFYFFLNRTGKSTRYLLGRSREEKENGGGCNQDPLCTCVESLKNNFNRRHLASTGPLPLHEQAQTPVYTTGTTNFPTYKNNYEK